MHHPTYRITHTTAFVTPVMEHWLEREIAQWVNPMKDWSDDPSHNERTLLPRNYISLPRKRKATSSLDGMVWCGSEQASFCQASPGRLAVLLQAVQEGWSCLVSCPRRSYTSDPLIYLEEWSSTSVWALSVYSDSSPRFGEVQSFCSRKKRYIW